jgi:hypothetical protein
MQFRTLPGPWRKLLLAVILAIFKPDWRVRRNTIDRRDLRHHLLDERALRL